VLHFGVVDHRCNRPAGFDSIVVEVAGHEGCDLLGHISSVGVLVHILGASVQDAGTGRRTAYPAVRAAEIGYESETHCDTRTSDAIMIQCQLTA